MINAVGYFAGFSVKEIYDFEFFQQIEIFVIAVNEKSREFFIIQPFSPIKLLVVVIPNAAEIAANDQKIIF